ncbi:DapH/DapD/GlmU-related protein [Elioraea sp. Yellowstone]|uniref:acyltransferase n=1 Tax=Elioraea sp. Yellowstone TaxID=2592070 RepID=UPI00192A1B29|nr:acyltransferase [Elioraea sp. Yellowstone]
MTLDAFVELLKAAALAREAQLREQFQRSLPFADAIFDRWERARRLGFGEGSSIYDSACVFGDVTVGRHVWIGPWVMLDGSGGLTIGDHVSLSAGVQIYTHDTVHWAVSGGVVPPRRASVAVGDRVYVGSQSVIAQGVTIGRKCVISANSLVIDDVPEATIVGGVPAVPIGRVEGEGAEVRLVFTRRRMQRTAGLPTKAIGRERR